MLNSASRVQDVVMGIGCDFIAAVILIGQCINFFGTAVTWCTKCEMYINVIVHSKCYGMLFKSDLVVVSSSAHVLPPYLCCFYHTPIYN